MLFISEKTAGSNKREPCDGVYL